MKAAYINNYGDKNSLTLGELPIPSFTDKQVLIKVVASGVNPIDFHVRNGLLAESEVHTLPLVLGWDAAGVIADVGAQVKNVNIGDAVVVFAPIDKQGANSEYLAVDADLVRIKPKSLSYIQAAALPLAGVTALQGLTQGKALQKGHKVLIHNAAGAVGSFAVQLAKTSGAYVVATASRKKHDYVSRLGADEVYTEDDPKWQGKQSYDCVFVAKTGDVLMSKSLDCAKEYGYVISTFDYVSEQTLAGRNLTFNRMMVTPNGKDLETLLERVTQGDLIIPIDSVYPIEQIKLAHERSESYQAVGKIILVLDPMYK